MHGSVFKRCTTCGGRVEGRRCRRPDCAGSRFTWSFVADVGRKPDGARRQIKRMGFETRREAEEALTELLRAVRAGTWVPPSRLTVAEYLIERWLPRTRTTEKTRADRELHMRVYVIPRIGGRLLGISLGTT